MKKVWRGVYLVGTPSPDAPLVLVTWCSGDCCDNDRQEIPLSAEKAALYRRAIAAGKIAVDARPVNWGGQNSAYMVCRRRDVDCTHRLDYQPQLGNRAVLPPSWWQRWREAAAELLGAHRPHGLAA